MFELNNKNDYKCKYKLWEEGYGIKRVHLCCEETGDRVLMCINCAKQIKTIVDISQKKFGEVEMFR